MEEETNKEQEVASEENTSDTQDTEELSREESFAMVSAVVLAALETVYDAGMTMDVSKVSFDLSADDGTVVVSILDETGNTEEQSVSASDIEGKVSGELSSEEEQE